MGKMDPMSGCNIRLVFTLPPRDSTLQYKRCVQLWNNSPYITPLSAYNSLYVCMTSHWFLNWTCHKFKVPLLVPLGKSWLYYFQVWSPGETFTEDDRWRSSHSLLILYLRYPWTTVDENICQGLIYSLSPVSYRTTDNENICQGLIYSLSPVSLNYRWKHMPRFDIFFISGIL